MQRMFGRFRGLAGVGLAAVSGTASFGGVPSAVRAASVGAVAPSSSATQTLTSVGMSAAGVTLKPFAASGAMMGVGASGLGGVRMKTTGVGVIVSGGDVDRAMRKLKRIMIGEGILREQKKRSVRID